MPSLLLLASRAPRLLLRPTTSLLGRPFSSYYHQHRRRQTGTGNSSSAGSNNNKHSVALGCSTLATGLVLLTTTATSSSATTPVFQTRRTLLESNKLPVKNRLDELTTKGDDNNNNKNQDKEESSAESSSHFDWSQDQFTADFWKNKILTGSRKSSSQTKDWQDQMAQAEANGSSGGGGFANMAKSLMSLMTGNENEKAISDIVATVRETAEPGHVEDSSSLDETLEILEKYKDLIGGLAEKYVSDIDFTKLTPTAIHYFLEYEDERKNPSWKCRAHRFCPGIDIPMLEQMHEALNGALLAYLDSVDEIKEELSKLKTPAELVYADVKSDVNQPAHFIAVRTNQSNSRWDPLEVIMAVRGTKSLADAVTDALCDSTPYRGGKAHESIVKGGKYLFEKHKDLLQDLCQKAGKSKVKLILIGHSLGAGACSIAGMEFNDLDNFDVQVVGFGCPALLSKELAENCPYITTVINDSDCIPRTSAATVTNLLLNLVEFDWIPYAKKDVRHALGELQRVQPSIFTDKFSRQVRTTVEPLMEQYLSGAIEKDLTNRIPTELYPPGKIIHLYRDGSGISGCITPNTFFNEIDLTRRMIDDHVFHSGYEQTFLEVMRQHKGDHHFKFEERNPAS